MTSLISTATQAAHSAAATLLAAAEIKVSGTVPETSVKIDSPTETVPLELKGKTVIVGVPGAFTGTCSAQVPGYIKAYEQFKEKGVDHIYIVAINDVFVMKAWKESMDATSSPVKFVADDKGAFVSSLGLVFDASALLGTPRSKRFALVAVNGIVTHLAVEKVPSELTVTAADKILAQL